MVRGMKLIVAMLALLATALMAEEQPAVALENEVARLIAGPEVTVVHFWAPWCGNSKAELTPAGWAAFIAEHPGVKFVFLNVWHKGQNPQPVLTAAGLGAQPNLVLRTHPNPSRLEEDRLNRFLGQPVTWLPTTWIYRAGKLRYAFNYGEIRFPVLRQMIEDSRNPWDHEEP
jgi:thiol-disulfide isomerase/thioredoxin